MSGGNQSKAHSALIRLITDYLQVRGAYTYKVWGSAFSTPGVPDLLACLSGRFLAIEAKTGKATLSTAQVRQKSLLEQSGAIYVEVREIEHLEDALLVAGLIDTPALMRWKEAR